MQAQDHETSLPERVYRRWLRLYPTATRERFAADMGDLFRDLRHAARRRHGLSGEVTFIVRACAEVPYRAFQARREERRRSAALFLRTDRREDVMGSLIQDLRFTLRALTSSRTTTLVAVLSLALGIGANTAIFSVLNGVYLRPLPYPEPDRLVMLAPDLETPAGELIELGVWSYPYFEALRQHSEVFEDVAAFNASALNLTGLEVPDRVRVEYTTASYFSLLGIDADLGRTFLPSETVAEAQEAVVVLHDGTWKRRFGSDPGVLGRKVRLNGVEHTVIGVAPPGFDGLSQDVELWLPLPMTQRLIHPRRLVSAYSFWHNALGRLRDGVTPEQASASFPSLAAAMTEAVPLHPMDQDKTLRVGATPLREASLDEGLRGPLALLFASVGLVLLIACANVANLLLSRAVARRREIGVRVALGAGRGRLVRQFLTESLVLGILASAVGLLFAGLGLRGLKAILPKATPGTWTSYTDAVSAAAVTIDVRVLLFTAALAMASALVFGLVPAVGLSRPDVRGALERQAPPLFFGHLRRWSLRNLLAVTQVALALVLLVGAGLMLRSFDRMNRTDPGFDPDGVLSAQVHLPRGSYDGNAVAFFTELMERLTSLPGVDSASQSISLPLLSNSSGTVMKIQGEETQGVKRPVGYHIVGQDHLRTLGIPLVRGRTFLDSDRDDAPLVALVNQAAAQRFWADQDPIGHKIWLGMGFEEDQWAEVVGVVGNVRYRGLREPTGPDVYVSARQWTEDHTYVLLRTAGDPLALAPALRREVAAIDADLPVYDLSTLSAKTAESRSHTRFLTLLLATFAALAVVLAATGIYGVMAYAVTTRTRELGIRMALGAPRESILRLVLSHGLALAVTGAAAGILAALYLTRFLTAQLYGVEAFDAPTLLATTAGLVLVAVVASFWPARRAGRLDPMTVLRNE